MNFLYLLFSCCPSRTCCFLVLHLEHAPLFELQVKFYPLNPRLELREDLTRYLMVLQLRQDVISGKLLCSFLTLAILGAYIAQAELGDYDSDPGNQGAHWEGNQWAPNQDARAVEHLRTTPLHWDYLKALPLAPQAQQSSDLLERVAELHYSLKGLSPELADLNFLDNARKLSLYGVDFHKARDADGLEVLIGVSSQGVLIYRDRLRVHRYTWAKILKITYKHNTFSIFLRPQILPFIASATSTYGTPDLYPRAQTRQLHGEGDFDENPRGEIGSGIGEGIGNMDANRKLMGPAREILFKLDSYRLAKRLWRAWYLCILENMDFLIINICT